MHKREHKSARDLYSTFEKVAGVADIQFMALREVPVVLCLCIVCPSLRRALRVVVEMDAQPQNGKQNRRLLDVTI